MRILIVGAGATGGAFGARLIQAGRDVTFLVREHRAEQLRSDGLAFSAPDVTTRLDVRCITSVAQGDVYDLIIVAVKAPALDAVIGTIRPAVGDDTLILPLLNGMRHIESLVEVFGARVLGGLVKIVATLDRNAQAVQLTTLSSMTLGRLDGGDVPDAVREALDVPGIHLSVSGDIIGRLWEKWAFIAAAGVVSCLFRGEVGDILEAGGEEQILRAIEECERVAAAAGHTVGRHGHEGSVAMLTEPGSHFTSSLYRDLRLGDPLEAEHILGDLAHRARSVGVPTPLLDAALLQVRTHRVARARTSAGISA
ncbi:ketopantoate reductase family protein [Tessaracoccus lacteus]|uniref:2-dehydropantoate 2-reductase n=1 Tax=Tessaracoccus lacteus TaxID=3041766 RepID=A0ABY8Q0F1_9ACTN|nr:2-dehydropantoate 2-reductase [Tessaracoccus sp. T21]WGT48279.1 2-dehydropantoate 2-reductase [Tessaracoccus sp. T21]